MWSRSKRSLEQLLEPAPRLVAVDAGRDEHVRGERGKAARHRPDVQVVHLVDVGIVDDRARDVVGIDPGRRRLEEDPAPTRGAASSSSEASAPRRAGPRSGRTRFQPVSRMSAPAIAVPTNAARSVATCRNAPRTLRLERSARASTSVAARFTAIADERDDEHDAAAHADRIDEPPDAPSRRSRSRARAA